MQDVGFRLCWFRVQGAGFRVQDVGFRLCCAHGSVFRIFVFLHLGA